MEHHFLEMRSLIKTSLRFIMKFPGEERSLIKTYLRSLIKTDFMEQPSDQAAKHSQFLTSDLSLRKKNGFMILFACAMRSASYLERRSALVLPSPPLGNSENIFFN